MARTGVRWGRIAAVSAAALVSVSLVGSGAAGTTSRPSPERPVVRAFHLVQDGDTLWALARKQVGPEGDPRPVVDAIRRANGLGTGPILAGQRLLLPTA